MLTSSQVSLLRKQAESGNLSMKCRERLGWILHFVEHGCSVGDTCKAFDISRSTFHRWLDRFDPNDLSSLEEKSHEPLNVRQSQVAPEIVEHIRKYRQDSPLMGKERIAELLERDHGVMLSGSTIGRVIDRECLYFADTPLHWKKRMGAATGCHDRGCADADRAAARAARERSLLVVQGGERPWTSHSQVADHREHRDERRGGGAVCVKRAL